jgi:hypothetical protein
MRTFVSPGVVREFVPRSQRVHHRDHQIRGVERKVVVATIPDDDVGLPLGPP